MVAEDLATLRFAGDSIGSEAALITLITGFDSRARYVSVKKAEEEFNRSRGADPSGGTGLPVHSHDAIERAEARAFGRRPRWRMSYRPKNVKRPRV